MINAAEIIARLFVHTPAMVFSTLGLLLMAAAAGMTFRAIRLTIGETIGGTIIVWQKRTSDDQLSYAPIVRFQAGSAGEFEVQSSTVFQRKPGDINVPVTVRYDPKNPKRAEIEHQHHSWRPVFAFLVLAAGALAVGWQAGRYPESSDANDVASDIALP